MKQLFTVLALSFVTVCAAQQITLKKGVIIDSLSVRDSVAETFSLYLPTTFENGRAWPIVFVFDLEGKGKQAMSMFKQTADEKGYLLASSNHISDTVAMSKNILATSRMINTVVSILPIHKERIYVGGFSSGGRFSTIVPTFIKGIKGVVTFGASIANTEVLSSKSPYHFVGVIGNSDHRYPNLLSIESTLNRLKFPNQLLLFDGKHEWPPKRYVSQALDIFTMASMAKGDIAIDTTLINTNYQEDLVQVNQFYTDKQPILANNLLDEMLEVYRPFKDTDSIKENRKILKKSRLFKNQKRIQNNNFLKEQFVRDDYSYYLEEDVLTYNYNNLGWWKYQIDELEKYKNNSDPLMQQMGNRLESYIHALIIDNIYFVRDQEPIDYEALNFLYMLKTVTSPKDYAAYLEVISFSAKLDDYGAALFYLEELLKQGFTDRDALYSLENTALLRIMPEYNEIIEQYLKDARYDVVPE